MRKATFLWIPMVAMLLPASGWSEQQPSNNAVAMANPSNPLLQLPGMHEEPLPSGRIGASMATTPTAAALPAPIVSDYTNYPNPFDSRKEDTVIAYSLDVNSQTTLTIYDLFGKEVQSWNFSAGSNGGKAGSNTIPWDGTNQTGRKVSKGGYIAQLEIQSPQGSATAIRKIGVIH